MQVEDALGCLGVARTIWIDDVFNKSPPDLAEMLINAHKIALECGFADIEDVLKKIPFGDDGIAQELTERLEQLGPERREKIQTEFFAREVVQQMFPTQELSNPAVERVCRLMKIDGDDCWNFDRGATEIPQLCKSGDAEVAYMIDLNESGGSKTRGLDMLEALHQNKSAGVAFILTHETGLGGEAAKERELRAKLMEIDHRLIAVPVCVVAKAGLLDPEDDEVVREELRTSIKRAGLRRSLSQVVASAQSVVAKAFDAAASGMLSVAPEQLEEFVFERGYKEGVSELHVVERIISSQIAQGLREFFGTDDGVLASARRLRALRNIPLAAPSVETSEELARFRMAEVWETPDLINKAMAPVACGDVFEVDTSDSEVRTIKRKFLLLAQPCDIALRPEGRARVRDTAFLVPLLKLRELSKAHKKDNVLPCKLDGIYWECDFEKTSEVRLDVLDLASFRTDGRICLDEGQSQPKDLVASQARIYAHRVANAIKVLTDGAVLTIGGQSVDPSLQMTFSHDGDFKQFSFGQLCDAQVANGATRLPALPRRVSWRLRRAGRVRMPFAVALLDQYLSSMGRHAF